jgi:hypothetical protein
MDKLDSPSAVTLANLAQAGRISTTNETSLDWEVRSGLPTAEGIGIYEESTNQSNSTVHQAHLNIATKRIAHRFQISRVKAAEAATRGVGALRDLFGEHIQEALESMLPKINNAIQVPDATTEIISLTSVLNDTAPYALIDPAVVPKWVPVVNKAGAPRAFSRNLMIDFEAQRRTAGRQYNLIMMNPNTETLYKKLFVNIAGNASLANYTNLGNLKAVDLGIGESVYEGQAITLEPAIPTGEIRFIRTAGVELLFFDMPLGNTRAGMPKHIDEVVNNSLGFPVRICSFPPTVPTILEFEFYTVCQMRVRNRQNVGAIKNLATDTWVV